ncbi:hypothetical protein BJ742DRAFT_776621 [Cladochytrium replicatum]|nr:hypothetical protein BJ742DRAFT_776621 [Cladochytrium replicatum]
MAVLLLDPPTQRYIAAVFFAIEFAWKLLLSTGFSLYASLRSLVFSAPVAAPSTGFPAKQPSLAWQNQQSQQPALRPIFFGATPLGVSAYWLVGVFCFIDLVFFAVLWSAQVPRFEMSAATALFITTVSWSINYALFAAVSIAKNPTFHLYLDSAPNEYQRSGLPQGVPGSGRGRVPTVTDEGGGFGAIPVGGPLSGIVGAGGAGTISIGDDDPHIVGSHRVNVLPKALARLRRVPSCRADSETRTFVPVDIYKAIPPCFVDVETLGFDGKVQRFNNVTLQDYTVADIAAGDGSRIALDKAVAEAGIGPNIPIMRFHGRLETSAIGLVRIVGFRDASGEPGSFDGNTVEVVECPKANWIGQGGEIGLKSDERCVDEMYQVGAEIFGTPPLTFWYSRTLNDVSSLEFVEVSLDAEDGTVSGGNVLSESQLNDQEMEQAALEVARRIADLRPSKFIHKIDVKLDAPGNVVFRFVNVTDGIRNTIPQPRCITSATCQSDKSARARAQPTFDEFGEAVGPDEPFKITVHPRPRAQFEDCTDLSILVPQPNDPYTQRHPVLPIHLNGQPVFNITIGIAASVDDVPSGQWQRLSRLDGLNRRDPDIEASEPGTYALLSVADARCSGEVEENARFCTVNKVLPPTIEVSAEPIRGGGVGAACVGAVGAVVNISLTGSPPFIVEYEEMKDSGERTQKKARIMKTKHVIPFEPDEPGTYVWEFTSILDMKYIKGVPIKNTRFTQTVHPRPRASILLDQPSISTQGLAMIRCLGDNAEVTVLASGGAGPWKVSYELYHNTKRLWSRDVEVNEGGARISTAALHASGTYMLSFIDILSADGCPGTFREGTQDVRIEVQAQRPTVSFKCPRPVAFLEGSSAQLELAVFGIPPFNISYVHVDTGIEGQYSTKRGATKKKEWLDVDFPGTYRLTGTSDSYCKGLVLPAIECQAVTIPRPTLSVLGATQVDGNRYVVPETCAKDMDKAFTVRLSGSAPFQMRYTHELPSRSNKLRAHRAEVEKRIEQHSYRVGLDTSESGKHVYRFQALEDVNYPTASWKGDVAVVTHNVLVRPTARFTNGTSGFVQCLNVDSQSSSYMPVGSGHTKDPSQGIQIEFTGKSPFELVVQLQHDGKEPQSIVVRNITETSHTFKPPLLSATGSYILQLVSLVDSTGCRSSIASDTPETRVELVVADTPRVTSLSARNVCVGDLLTFTLQGTPTFRLEYEFEGKFADVSVMDPVLTLYAGKPGLLRVRRVWNGVGCVLDLRKPEADALGVVVHPLPRAIVDGGEDLAEDIREGEESIITIEFEGEAPFSFTYSRSTLNPITGDIVGEEAFTITNIDEPSYVIRTRQEGLFQVTAVYDAHCGYPRLVQSPENANAVIGN